MSRTPGREGGLRLPRRRDSSDLRRHDALQRPSRPGPPRARRHAHGRRLRPRRRRRGRSDRHFRPRRNEHGHRHRHRDAGFLADRLHHRPGRQQTHRLRRIPRNRHHRHHSANHQTQLSSHARARYRPKPARSLSHRRVRPPRPSPGRHHQGRPKFHLRIRLGCRRAKSSPHGASPFPEARRTGKSSSADQRSAKAGNSRRPRHHSFRRDARSDEIRRKSINSRSRNAARPRRLSQPRILYLSA